MVTSRPPYVPGADCVCTAARPISRQRAVKRIAAWCRLNRHMPVVVQRQVLWQKLRGHFQYYGGVVGNIRSLWCFRERVQEIWRKWLSRRGGQGPWTWDRFHALFPGGLLPEPLVRVQPCVVSP